MFRVKFPARGDVLPGHPGVNTLCPGLIPRRTEIVSRTGLKVKKKITWPHGLGYLTGCWRCGVKPKQYVGVLRSVQLLSPGSMGLAVVEVMLEWMPWN